GGGLATLAWVPAAWIAGTAETFATLPGSVVDVPQGPGGLVVVAVLGAAVAALVVAVSRRVRGTAAVVLAAAIVAGLAMGPIARVVTQATIPPAWSVVACDVGQGDAVLIRSAGFVALVDTGPDPAALARCLDIVAVTRIDLLVLTHFDLDHRGGVDAVAGRVGTVVHGPADGPDDAALIARLEKAGAEAVTAVKDMSGILGECRWRVLWPAPRTAPGNDASVVVEWRGGGVPTMITLGDLSAEGQRAMAAGAALRGGYDVVKVAHHGSADQDAALYRTLRPAVALVTVGENDYGHPRAETLALLSGLGAFVARTDREGMLAVWRDDEGLRVWHERAPADVDGGR
ncbi:MAG TPA: MBL fold metallo-hydrolase, partial [Microbacterium sp.]|nr:MBL fold metallo-hydrolase [Microbacterium sp.]